MSVYLKQEQGWESRTIFTAPGSAALRAATKSGSRLGSRLQEPEPQEPHLRLGSQSYIY